MAEGRMKKLNNAGFTLVELVVVLLLITILLGVGAAGIIAFQDQAHRIKLDDNAETIFTAAQSRLTRMNSSGDLRHWREKLKDADGNYRAELIVPVFDMDKDVFVENSAYITKSILPADSVFNTAGMLQDSFSIWQDKEEGHVLVALRASAGDYDTYLTAPGSLRSDTLFLFNLLTEEISDPEILNSAICLEIAPEDAQVFSAFYSTDAVSFAYKGETEGAGGEVDLSRREYTSREKKELGYFGVETLSHVSVKPPQDLKLGSLTVQNGNTLNYHLSFDGEVDEAAPGNLDYTMTVYDVSGKKALEFTFSGGDVKNRQEKITDNYVDCVAKRFNYDQEETGMGIYPIALYWEKKGTDVVPGLSFILDAADASATTALLDGSAYDEAKKIREGGQQNGSFVQTLSFFRFGTWTEMGAGHWCDEIYVKITAVDSGDGLSGLETEADAVSDSESPYFAKLETKFQTGDDTNHEFRKYADITNPRHLYNIRYFEDLEWGKLGVNSPSEGSLNHNLMSFRICNDLDWEKFAGTDKAYYATKNKLGIPQTSDERAADFAFPSIRCLRKHDLGKNKWSYDSLSASDGTEGGFAVCGLTIRKRDNDTAKVYALYAADQVKPTGLFLENSGNIEHFVIDRSRIEGGNRVGAVCGVNNGTLSYCETRSTRDADHEDPTLVEGLTDVGGLFGYNGRTGDVFYDHLKNAARVQGEMYVGGITGRLVNNGTGVALLGFSDCSNSGQVLGAAADSRYIGGIVGYIRNDGKTVKSCYLKNCSSLPEYSSEYDKAIYDCVQTVFAGMHADLSAADAASLNEQNKGDYVGGIAGFAKDVTFVNCGAEASADPDKCAVVFGRQYVGGIVGLCAAVFDDTAAARTVNVLPVCGDSCVGGIAGCTSAVSLTGDDVALTGTAADVSKVNVYGTSNRASVFAVRDYAGGLVGLSYGGMKQNSVGMEGARVKVSGRNYVGSVTGRHRGNQTQGAPVRFDCNVDGENYVGGLVGFVAAGDQRPFDTLKNYNGNPPFVDFYGEVYGNGCFTGGMFGAICEVSLLDQGKYRSFADSVKGRFYVGGAVGAAVFNLSGSDTKNMKYNIIRPSMQIRATAFAGGFAGFTATVAQKGEAIGDLLDDLGATGMGGEILLPEEQKKLEAGLARHRAQDDQWVQSGTIKINGLYSDKLYGLEIDSIEPLDEEGLVHAGGIIGANGKRSVLVFEGVNLDHASDGIVSATPHYVVKRIRATTVPGSCVAYIDPEYDYVPEIGDKGHLGYVTVPFSYSGPLIGVNTVNSVIRNSYMTTVMDTADAYFHGGMCEVNEGTMEWRTKVYEGPTTGWKGWQGYFAPEGKTIDRVGAMCGLNASGATVKLLHSPRFVVDGGNVVGGLVGENEGLVVLSVGGSRIFKQCVVTASGSVAGGVIGRNGGDVQVNAADPEIKLSRGVKISGKDAVGGFIGEQIGGVEFSKLHIGDKDERGPEIHATEGAAGGVYGRLVVIPDERPFKLHGCNYTKGDDLALIHGKYAGGLVGEIRIESKWEGEQIVEIYECSVYGKVQSDSTGGAAGGIIGRIVTGEDARGNVKITDCRVNATLSQPEGNTAGIVCDGGGWAVIDACRVYSAAGHAITVKNARAVTNCLAINETDTFAGVVELSDKDNFRNNYCVVGTIDAKPPVLEEPKDSGGTSRVTEYELFAVKNQGRTYYAYWTGKDKTTGEDVEKVFKMLTRGGSDGDEFMKVCDELDKSFKNYLGSGAHRYASPY